MAANGSFVDLSSSDVDFPRVSSYVFYVSGTSSRSSCLLSSECSLSIADAQRGEEIANGALNVPLLLMYLDGIVDNAPEFVSPVSVFPFQEWELRLCAIEWQRLGVRNARLAVGTYGRVSVAPRWGLIKVSHLS